MSLVVAQSEPHDEPAPEGPPGGIVDVAIAVGEQSGKLDAIAGQITSCDHSEIMQVLGEVQGKLDALVSFVDELAKAELEEVEEQPPMPEETVMLSPEPEPEPPEHPFFRKIA